MDNSLIITTPQAMTAPLPNTPKLRLSGDSFVLTSDTFSGANTSTLAGRVSDAARGGAPIPYELLATTEDAWKISGSTLAAGVNPGSSAALLPLPAARSKDVTASVRIVSLPAGGTPSVSLLVRRDKVSGSQNQVRVTFNSTSMQLYTHVGGVQTTVSGALVPVAPGDVVGLREYDGLIQMVKNGEIVWAGQNAPGTFIGNYAGFASFSGAAGFAFDDFTVIETLH